MELFFSDNPGNASSPSSSLSLRISKVFKIIVVCF
jgi:hypothetical protein